jgi:signal transduction histidine kinase
MTQMAMDMDIFTAGVLHDIRNIETSISALCDLIRMQMMEDPIGNRDRILDDIASLKGQANRISTYATNILQNLKQTSSQPKIESVPIARITEWVKGMISHRSDMNGSTLTIHLSQPLKPIAGDLHLLELVFLNLCQNSVRYARSGVPAEVTVYQRPSASEFRSGRPTAITCIRDNGIGIPKDDLRKVFLPFVRGDSSGGARPKGGFGLGLALVSKAVSMMGGRVWAELPEDGQPGTVICIELPEGEA